jgi:hypothetical protein
VVDINYPSAIRTAATQNMVDNRASEFAKRILNKVQEYDATLDTAHETGLWLANFGQAVIIHIQDIGYSNPSLIWFIGTMDNGEPVELIQHVSQISLLLMQRPRPNPEQPKRPIGFLHKPEEEADA